MLAWAMHAYSYIIVFSYLINSMKALLIRILIEDEQTARHQQH